MAHESSKRRQWCVTGVELLFNIGLEGEGLSGVAWMVREWGGV